jgi:hypothetical protein
MKRHLESQEHYESIPQVCGICRSTQNLVRDHDHDTGRCRGWLCRRCNIAFGYVEGLSRYAIKWKELEIMRAMLAYAEYWGEMDDETGKFRSQMTPLFPNHKKLSNLTTVMDLISRL